MIDPILLPDNGLREAARGTVRGFEFTVHHNPELICQIICERRKRNMITIANERIVEPEKMRRLLAA